jgi:DNA-binding transcriptional LysR family regulator
MELGQLEAFLVAVRVHSFSRAAAVIGVTQPSLSARILSLEAELGEPLFHRVGRGVRLTDTGRTFLPFVQRAMDTLQRGKDTIESSRAATAGRLHIGAARGISSAILPGILETFHDRHPGIDVAIRTGRSYEVLELILSEEIQVGVSRALYHPEVVTTHLYDEEIVLVTHPNHPFAQAGRASIYDVGSEPLIIYDKESTYFVLIDRVCREAGILPNIAMDLDSIESTKRMIERGLGISFLPFNSLKRELETGTLAHVRLIEGHRITLPTAVMVRRASSYGPLVTAFLELLQDMFGAGAETGNDTHQSDNAMKQATLPG